MLMCYPPNRMCGLENVGLLRFVRDVVGRLNLWSTLFLYALSPFGFGLIFRPFLVLTSVIWCRLLVGLISGSIAVQLVTLCSRFW